MTKEEYVKKLIDKKGIKLKAFAEDIEVPYTTLVTILKNNINRASVDNVIKIANGLGTTVEGLERMYKESLETNNLVKESSVEYLATSNVEMLQIPYFGDIAAGALATVNPVLESELSFVSIPSMFLGKMRGSEELISFRVNGESMNMIIPNGSTVVAKVLSCESVKDGDIVIFSHDGQYSMKRFRRDEQDRVLIFSPESTDKKFRDTIISYETQNDLKIYAKVIWYGVSI
ncbi:XRE family transcriptional regulator (plasmid) [Lysinibacillus capsici]|uniref:LexA family transcriptional regulator n=1 Tax=Lysinibacillus capsici TaxID=2115968 RepID=UPI0021D97FFD|nr:XRE family transcriptional regulator [Lysinibacillus capsici]UYB50410.1 XRE family transcriptional regulator [Lysinibacillus capsici]